MKREAMMLMIRDLLYRSHVFSVDSENEIHLKKETKTLMGEGKVIYQPNNKGRKNNIEFVLYSLVKSWVCVKMVRKSQRYYPQH